MFTMTIASKYSTWSETTNSLEGARLRAAAIYGDCIVVITDKDGKTYSRYEW